jgi:hypothetical protein
LLFEAQAGRSFAGYCKSLNYRQCMFYALKVCNVEHLQEWTGIQCLFGQVKTFACLHWCECWTSPNLLTAVIQDCLWRQAYGTTYTLCWNLRFHLGFKLQFCSSHTNMLIVVFCLLQSMIIEGLDIVFLIVWIYSSIYTNGCV